MTNGQTRRTALGAMAAGVGVAGAGLMAWPIKRMRRRRPAERPSCWCTAPGTAAGAGGGCPTCWRRQGHKVFAPTMTGLGERSHLIGGKIDLATHVTDIVNVIKWEASTTSCWSATPMAA